MSIVFSKNRLLGYNPPRIGSLVFKRGDVVFTGVGQRIVGDFSTLTNVDRPLVQTSVTNGATTFGVIPNGSGNTGVVVVYNNSVPTNSSNLAIRADSSSTKLISQASGSGTVLPLEVFVGAINSARFPVNGDVEVNTNLQFMGSASRIRGDFSNATIPNRVSFQTSVAASNTSISLLPNGASQSQTLALNSDTAANCGFCSFGVNATNGYVISSRLGSGTSLPFVVYVGNTPVSAAVYQTSGNVDFGFHVSARSFLSIQTGAGAPQSGAISVDLSLGQNPHIVLNGNATITFNNGVNGVRYVARLVLSASSLNVTFAFPGFSGPRWENGVVQNVTSTAGKEDLLFFHIIGTVVFVWMRKNF